MIGLIMILLLILQAFIFDTPANALDARVPDRLNFELLPMVSSATHVRGAGFGLSLEKVNAETGTITAIQGDLSFPFMQKRLGQTSMFGSTPDWNGSLNLMAEVKPTIHFGGKVGASMLVKDGPVGFMAVSLRMTPSEHPDQWGFFNFCTKQLDAGIFATRELYAVIRLGFQLYHYRPSER
jgi:hypothetical protein